MTKMKKMLSLGLAGCMAVMNDGDHLVAYAPLPAGTTTSCRMNVHTYVGQHM